MMTVDIKRLLVLCITAGCVVSIFMAATLFYVTVPHIFVSKGINNAKEVTQHITQQSSADFAVFWELNLDTNSHRVISYAVKDQATVESLLSIMGRLENLKLTSVFGPDELYRLMSGKQWCVNKMLSISEINPDSRTYFESHKNSYICVIPVFNRSNALLGDISIIWRQKPSDLEIESIISQVQKLTAQEKR